MSRLRSALREMKFAITASPDLALACLVGDIGLTVIVATVVVIILT